jgi:hypothetical protein
LGAAVKEPQQYAAHAACRYETLHWEPLTRGRVPTINTVGATRASRHDNGNELPGPPRRIMGLACRLALVFLILVPFGVLALHDVNRRPTRQFTIRGMLLFIFLWAVCLSQMSVFGRDRPTETVVWRQDWIVLFAWIVLAVCYVGIRQFSALLIHATGVLFFVCCFAIAFALGGRLTWSEVEWRLWTGMIGGSFLGLVFYSLMMLLAIIRRPLSAPSRKEDRQT